MRGKNLFFQYAAVSLFLFAAVIAFPWQKGVPPAVKVLLPPAKEKLPTPITAPSLQEKKVYLVVIDGLTLEDLSNAGHTGFKKLLEQGAQGLMNCNTAGESSDPESAYITLGAGAHAKAVNTAGLGRNAGEEFNGRTAAEELRISTGINASPKSVVHLGVEMIKKQNAGLPYPLVIGALGVSLHKAGLRTAVLGNADTGSEPWRQAVAIAMDGNGLVDSGDVGAGMLVKNSSFPGGYRTSYEKIAQQMKNLSNSASFLVIETGDLRRLEQSRKEVTEDTYWRAREEILREIDRFIGEILENIKLEKDLLLVVSPTPHSVLDGTKNFFSPVLAAGGGVKKGFLFSPSTKRTGIILNVDIAPTVLRFFSVDRPVCFSGQPLQIVEGENRLAALQAMQKNMALIYNLRSPLQKAYIVYQLTVIAAGLYAVFRRRRRDLPVFALLFYSVVSVPLGYLLLPLFPQPSETALVFKFIVLTAGITFLALAIDTVLPWGAFLFLGLLTATVIVGDTLAGSPLQKTSVMGYDPIVGARFYGIGNEFMGILIGSLLVGSTILYTVFPRRRKVCLYFVLVAYLFALLVLGSPRWGTNLGGTIAAFVAFGTTFLFLRGAYRRITTFGFLTLLAIFLAGALLYLDLQRPIEAQTHFGRNTAMVLGGGWPEAVQIVKRKTELNIKLFKYTIWSRLFAASLGSLAFLFYYPVGVTARIKEEFPDLFAGFSGTVAGSIAALIFNDSGIVAAATTIIYTPPLLLMIVLKNTKNFI